MDKEKAQYAAESILAQSPKPALQRAKKASRFRGYFDRFHTALVALVVFGMVWRFSERYTESDLLSITLAVILGLVAAVVFPPRRQA